MSTYTVVVFHSGYGCDTGCCGHRIELSKDGLYSKGEFEFEHHWDEDETSLEFAKGLVEKHFGADHVVDLDWENCMIVNGDDCFL